MTFISALATNRSSTWIGIAATVAVLAATLVTAPAQPVKALPVFAPKTIMLTANRATIAAGQTVTLTATTDVPVQGSGSSITIVNQTTGATLATCTTGTKCIATVTMTTGGPDTFAATVDGLTSETLVIQREEWVISLAADQASVGAGAKSRLVATTNQDLSKTGSNFQTFVFDLTTSTLVGTCSTGKVCAVRTTAFTGSGQHNFVAVVAAAGSPATFEDAVDVQAQSEVTPVGGNEWSIAISIADGSSFEVGLGRKTRITSTTNQNVGSTSGAYRTYIFDVTDDAIIGSCLTGRVCTVTTPAFAGYAHEYVAFVAAAGNPTGLRDAQDVRTQSELFVVEAAGWFVSLHADRTEFPIGRSAKLTATANQNVGGTGGTYAIHIFDRTTGQ